MPYYPISSIIQYAKICQGVAEVDSIKSNSIGGGFVDDTLALKLWIEWQSLQDASDYFPDEEGTERQADYVLSLCTPYLAQAIAATGGGGVPVTPITPITPTTGIYPFIITQANLTWDGSNLVYLNTLMAGDSIIIFVNEFSQQWLMEPTYFTNVAAGGFKLDSTLFPNGTTPLTITVLKLNS
jgi:hypothetical protein